MLAKMRLKRNKVFAVIALVWGAGSSYYVFADEPDNFQLKVIERYQDKLPADILNKYQQGVFDLSNETSTFVSVATKSMIGTSPGVRTIATVNNDLGELRACSTVTINYQIIDIDGDWDSDKTYDNVPDGEGGTYIHNKTSDTIEWSIKLQTGYGEIIVPLVGTEFISLISNDKLELKIPETINVDGTEYSTIGSSIIYQLIPHTMIGSNPFYPAAYDYVVVDDLTQGKFLMPGEASGANATYITSNQILNDVKDIEVDTQTKLNNQHYLTFPGLPNPDVIENRSFILNNVIKSGDPNDCLVQEKTVEVEIYEAADPKKVNVIQPGAWSGRPTIFVKNRYQAEIRVKDKNGNKRKLTRKEFENIQNPFTWNVYYTTDSGNCSVSDENAKIEGCLSKEAFNIATEEFDQTRFGAVFVKEDGIDVLDYAWIDLQKVNQDDLLKNKSEEGSEQGAILSVSFAHES
ncbi:hypothetical protein [Thorsellia kenyensis]|uniref:DUF4179 domain-containing protein n=1 Tax=Thorsellia kenyensis TaxID=1549888 RepID=A0ABV6C906_9GAMM